MFKKNYLLKIFIVSFVVVSLLGIATAQDSDMIEPLDLASSPLVLEFSTGGAGPPTIEFLTDGRMTFRVTGIGEVSGAFNGNITARISEVTPNPSPSYHPITVMFTVESEQGMFEGYYAGSFHQMDGADYADISASGKILSASGAYADLYLADVIVTSEVQFVDGRSVGESGTITISAR